MRKTRPEDFDPDYKAQSPSRPEPEKVNMEGVVPIKPKPSPAPNEGEEKTARTNDHIVRTTVRPNDRTVERNRSTKRHAFEIYRDQLERLKTLKAMAMLDGSNTSMSEMVREAIDSYLDESESQ